MISDAAKQFHALLAALPDPDSSRSLEQARLASDAWAIATTDPADVTYEAVDADGVPGEWLVPAGAGSERAFLYLHGGGYCQGSIVSHRKLAGHLAKAAGMRGLIVDYRLAPEHPFPAALDDALAAFAFLLEGGYEAHRTGIAGDSAGGGLALATALALREADLPAPGGLVLLSPWTDLACTGDSLTGNLGKDLLIHLGDDSPGIGWYAGDNDLRAPLISPLYADYANFPPFIVHVGAHEVLLDDSTRLAERAREAGCDVTLEIWPEMQHVFQIAAGNVPESDASVSKLGAWLDERLRA